jgi:hypothetical protein
MKKTVDNRVLKAFEDRLILDAKKRARTALVDKFEGFLLDRVDQAVVTPRGEMKSMVARGKPRGDAMREVTEAFFQFKQFPILLFKNSFRRNLTSSGSSAGELSLMAQHMVLLTGMGAVAMTLKDVAKNREPMSFDLEDPVSVSKYWLAAFLNGGAGGLYADFLSGQLEYGRGDAIRFAGPAANDFKSALDVGGATLKKFMSDDYTQGEVGSEMWDLINGNVPFANIFYTRELLNMSMIYWMRESLDPGALDRQAAWMARENRDFILDPREHALGVD